MALIPKFTNTDPNARVSFSFKRSARKQLDLYRHFYKEQYDDADLPERGPLVEQILVALLAKDIDFKKWVDGLKRDGLVIVSVESGLDREEGIEAKIKVVVPAAASASAPVAAIARVGSVVAVTPVAIVAPVTPGVAASTGTSVTNAPGVGAAATAALAVPATSAIPAASATPSATVTPPATTTPVATAIAVDAIAHASSTPRLFGSFGQG